MSLYDFYTIQLLQTARIVFSFFTAEWRLDTPKHFRELSQPGESHFSFKQHLHNSVPSTTVDIVIVLIILIDSKGPISSIRLPLVRIVFVFTEKSGIATTVMLQIVG